ncbi:MAG: hypothetical protein K0R07_1063 [Sedimentibacter sp.]|jgi:hypothetical protein|nr:hypothetical protein [Sedimentibacter sp.]
MEKYQTPAKFCINLVGAFRFMANITDTKGGTRWYLKNDGDIWRVCKSGIGC